MQLFALQEVWQKKVKELPIILDNPRLEIIFPQIHHGNAYL